MKLLVIIIAATIIGLVAFGATSNFIKTNNEESATTSQNSGNNITVLGEVNRPGTYVLDEGATILDLINAASGVTTNADSLAFNTDYVVKKNGSYYIAPIYDNSNTCAVTPIEKCNVNTADASTLVSVAGFGKAAASALVSYRISSTFNALEDIKNVSGIGDGTYITVRDRITIRDNN